jgi:hypothetical protein
MGGWFFWDERHWDYGRFGCWYPQAEQLGDGSPLTRREAAWRFLILESNMRLEDNCAPCLYPRSRRPESYVIRLAPRSLLGAIWWQFARVVTGESRYQPCRVCNRLIEISTGGKPRFRADREFCSGTCKVRDHRRKVRDAKKMKAKGRTVRQIAKHFETSMAVITNWLTKKK